MSTPKRKLSIEDVGDITGITEDADNNLLIGDLVGGASITTAEDNIAIGTRAAEDLTEGFHNVLIGEDAGANITTANEVTAVGYRALINATGVQNTSFGALSGSNITTGTRNVSIGHTSNATTTTGSYNICIGYNASASSSSGSYSVAIGAGVSAPADSMVVGNDVNGVTDVYYGKGVQSASAVGVTIHGGGGSGTDNAGANLNIAGGKGTGNAAGGDLVFQTADAGASGSTLQSLTEKGRVDAGTGAWIFNAPTSAPADGDLSNNQFTIWYDSGGPSLTFKHKDGGGTVRTGTIALS